VEEMRFRVWLIGCMCIALLFCSFGPIYEVAAQTEWTKYPGNPVVTHGPDLAWDWFVLHPSVLEEPMGYKMWFTAQTFTAGGDLQMRVGLATGTDQITWTKNPSPVMDIGLPGSWEEVGALLPRVIADGSGYKMWYTGWDASDVMQIGYATSPDGITWTRSPGNPVLTPGGPAEWDASGTAAASVLFLGGEYHAWYTGNDASDYSRIGYATSTDGIIWNKHAGNPVLDLGASGEWDAENVLIPWVLFDGMKYEMWYMGIDASMNFAIGYATSTDGLVWTKYSGNPVLSPGPSGSWDDGAVQAPSVLYTPTGYDMWYNGASGMDTGIGYANSTLPVEHPPVLAGGSVTPSAGLRNAEFVYNVTYSDEDNDPPAYVRAWINKSGVPVGASPYDMSFDAWVGAEDDWSAGANFMFPINLSAEGADYAFAFSTSDGGGTVFTPEIAGPMVFGPFDPPSNVEASLGGMGFSDVTVYWWASNNDTGPGGIVERYDILYGSVFDDGGTGYSSLGSVPAVGLESYFYDHVGGGEGDASNYFYVVCAVNAFNASSCSSGQAGKFTRLLSPGPTLVSVPLNQSDETIETVLQTVKYDRAWAYDLSSGEWNWYMKSKEYRRGLWIMDHTDGLWVNVTESSRLTVAGAVPVQTVIHLQAGWNLVSFPSFNGSYTVGDLKAETGATRVEGLETMPPYPPCRLRVLGDAEVLQSGEAYWVRMDADTDWIVEVT
jgi:predicted GH43/DUF377 family glycosyl hydrolase